MKIKMYLKKILFFVLAIFLLTGCISTKEEKMWENNSQFIINKYNQTINFDKIMNNAVKSTVMRVDLPLNEKIIVTDFVEVGTLKNDTKLGFILSNKLKNALVNAQRFRVEEAEVSKFFRIGKDGLKLLSRNKDNLLNNRLRLHFALVGTYAITSNRLIIFVKLIDVTDGRIIESYSKDIPATSEIIGLASGNSN